jgi:N-acetyl-D-muramate 6-phosphate phosphatase
MNHSLQAVLLDLDGTLLDTAPDFFHIANRLLDRHDCPPIDYPLFRQSVSDGARGMVSAAFGFDEADVRFEPLRQEFLALYANHLADHSRPFPGIEELLAYVEDAGMQWGVVTNKPEIYAAPLMRALQLDQRCATLICPDHVVRRKPDPEALHLACERIGCSPAQAIYIGDHRRDIEAGHNAGMSTVACSYGYVHRDDPCDRWGAEFIVHDPRQIIEIVRGWMG